MVLPAAHAYDLPAGVDDLSVCSLSGEPNYVRLRSERGTHHDWPDSQDYIRRSTSPCCDRRWWVWRYACSACAAPRASPCYGDRPHEPFRVSPAALPGRYGGTFL